MLHENLSGWKGNLLSHQEILILVKFVLCSIHKYNMAVYKWPRKVIKECIKNIRNFLWTGDPSKRKVITLKWDYVCTRVDEGGLGLRILEQINKAMPMVILESSKWWGWNGKILSSKVSKQKRRMDWILQKIFYLDRAKVGSRGDS